MEPFGRVEGAHFEMLERKKWSEILFDELVCLKYVFELENNVEIKGAFGRSTYLEGLFLSSS